MTTEVTYENLLDVKYLIEKAIDLDNVVPIVEVRCKICGKRAYIKDLDKFAEGAVPIPDPFPLGARVVHIGLGWAGKVIESRIAGLPGEKHRHRREVAVKPDDGGNAWFCQIEGDYDTCSERYILESEREAQQEGGRGAQGG